MVDDNIRFVEDNNIQWVEDNNQQWGLLLGYDLSHIWTDADYVYAVTVSGLDVIDITSELKIAFIDYTLNGGFSTVWADNSRVFVGTTGNLADGIKYIDKTCISGTHGNQTNLLSCLEDYIKVPLIDSNDIKYIHGNGELMCCCTVSGVDVINTVSGGYHSSTSVENTSKCFMASTGKFYYTINDGLALIPGKWNESDSGSYITISNRGLTTRKSTLINTWTQSSVRSIYKVEDGKWYWEFTPTNVTGGCLVGIGTSAATFGDYCGKDDYGWSYSASTGNVHHGGVTYSYGASWFSSNIIGIALNMVSGKIWFSIDGVWQNSGDPVADTGEAFSGLTGEELYTMVSHYVPNQIGTMNFGKTPFTYSPPSGFDSGFGFKDRNVWSVNVVNEPYNDWNEADVRYITGADILPSNYIVNDIFVNEGTAANTFDNVLFVATSNGVYVIDEGDLTFDVVGVPSIYEGDEESFTAVWADTNKLYSAVLDAFFIMNLSDYSLLELYDIETYGEATEPLAYEDIVDINIRGGM